MEKKQQRNHYDWTNPVNVAKAKYKMVMYLRAGCTLKYTYRSKKDDPVFVTYGYYRKPDQGLAMLKSLYREHMGKVNKVLIYEKNDNTTNFPDLVFKDQY